MISIIVPVFNVETYLPRCINSLIRQTYKSIEIILVDDGSTDRSGNICDEWANKDHRIRVIHKANGGVSSARNAGIRVAEGNFLGFVDGDDYIEPKMYETMLKCIEKNNADIAMCGYVDYPYGIEVPVYRGVEVVLPCGYEEALVQIYKRNGFSTSMWNKLYRKKVLGGLLLNESISVSEDELWLVKAISKCSHIAFVPEALYHWMPRDGSAIRSHKVTQKRMTVLEAKHQAISLMPEPAATLAKATMYNDCYYLKVDAYLTGTMDYYKQISKAIRPYYWKWLKTDNISAIRKIKVLIMGIEMMLRMPVKIVEHTNNMTNNSFKRW